jgi:hypothetical protein
MATTVPQGPAAENANQRVKVFVGQLCNDLPDFELQPDEQTYVSELLKRATALLTAVEQQTAEMRLRTTQ